MYSDGLLKLPIFTIQKNFKILLTVYSLSPPGLFSFTLSPPESHALKWQISRSLKRKFPNVAFRQHSVFSARNRQFHPVTALYLKRDIVAGTWSRMVAMSSRQVTRICMAMMCDIFTLCDDGCTHRQTRWLIVFVPCSDSGHKLKDDHTENDHKDNWKHIFKQHKHITHPFLILRLTIPLSTAYTTITKSEAALYSNASVYQGAEFCSYSFGKRLYS